MTEKEINEARYIKDNILPKLQEIQRDVYMDEHIIMSIEMSSYKNNMQVWVHVNESHDRPNLDGSICYKCFYFNTYVISKSQRKENEKALRGVRWFVKNWQERLG